MRIGPPALSGIVLAAALVSSVPASPTSGATRAPRVCTLGTRLGSWSTARLAAQTLVVPVDEGSLSQVSAAVRSGVGGVILLGDDATRSLKVEIAALDAEAEGGISPAVMVDEEGGTVQHLADLVGSLPSARTMAATLSDRRIEALGRRTGARLRALGVTIDLAPVLDLDAGVGPNDRDADGTRSFSADPATAYAAAAAFARGLQSEGIVPVDKHFPGLGGATANTDVAPASTVPYSSLKAAGLVPFEEAISAGAPAIMVSNASIPGLSVLPASLSPAVIGGLLHHDLGFRGLVITDSLSVPSVTGADRSLARSVVFAIGAGADMVLFNAPAASTVSTTADLVTAITDAVRRHEIAWNRLVSAVGEILTIKHALPSCPS